MDRHLFLKRAVLSMLLLCLLLFASCSSGEERAEEQEEHVITVGFSQVGAESDWRLASTVSMTEAFEEAGFNLIMENARQKPENQLRDVRGFIDQKVDYIVIDPITEDGWEATLRDAAQSGIPVIIVDRSVAVSDENLYAAWIGENFELEGKKACAWLRQFLALRNMKTVNIIHIRGTEGSSAQIGRTKALEDAAAEYGWNILSSADADFVQAKGREVCADMIAEFGREIQVVYCENDNEAYGALQALNEAGIRTGTDIENGEVLVISFDSSRTGLHYTLYGQIAFNVECSPLYGPDVISLIRQLEAGEETERRIYQEESQFSAFTEISEIEVDGTKYPVEMLTEELLAERAY